MVCGRVHVCACALPPWSAVRGERRGSDRNLLHTTAPLTSRHHCGHNSTITCVLLVLGRLSWRRPRLRSLSVWWLVVTRCLLAWAGPERLGERRDTHPGVFWMVRTFLLFRLHHAAKATAVVVAAEMPSIPVSDGRGDHLTRSHTPT
uniref:(northern house mosquito) hypothetical protein n=1 Tax=Culex pipiens TaxID=7175 RepID=A0A8D8KK55_CULPI